MANGDLSQKITVEAAGEILDLKGTINGMVDNLKRFGDEVTRVAREVGGEGKLGAQADVPGVSGTWKDLTDNVNALADNLTKQVRNIAQVTTAVANGDLDQKITVEAAGEILDLKDTINTMVDNLGCLESCAVCDEPVCPSCMTACPECGERLCKNCLEEMKCSCIEENEENEDDSDETEKSEAAGTAREDENNFDVIREAARATATRTSIDAA